MKNTRVLGWVVPAIAVLSFTPALAEIDEESSSLQGLSWGGQGYRWGGYGYRRWSEAVPVERVDGEQVPGGCPIESPTGRFLFTARNPGTGLDIYANQRAGGPGSRSPSGARDGPSSGSSTCAGSRSTGRWSTSSPGDRSRGRRSRRSHTGSRGSTHASPASRSRGPPSAPGSRGACGRTAASSCGPSSSCRLTG